MMGFTRCASTTCFTQADTYVAGVPLCAEHREELRNILCASTPPAAGTANPGRTWSRVAKSYRNPAPVAPADADPPQPADRQQREVRITSRVRLSPHQSATDPGTSELLGCVYYVTTRKNAEFVKIGTTRQASSRFRSLMGNSGERPRLLVAEPGDREKEGYRHRQFDHIRIDGTEFFRYTDELVDHIGSLRSRFPNYRDFTDVGRSYD